jgi:hypothetical protein
MCRRPCVRLSAIMRAGVRRLEGWATSALMRGKRGDFHRVLNTLANKTSCVVFCAHACCPNPTSAPSPSLLASTQPPIPAHRLRLRARIRRSCRWNLANRPRMVRGPRGVGPAGRRNSSMTQHANSRYHALH